MKASSIVIYISPKIVSKYTIDSLELILGTPSLVRLLQRLQKGLPAGDFEFTVLCHDGPMPDKLTPLLQTLGVHLWVSKAPGRLQAFAQFVHDNPAIKTLLIFPEESLFPDCFLTSQMLRFHRKDHVEATLSPDHPLGLLPEIYESTAIHRLVELELSDDISTNFASVMSKANELFEGDEEVKDLCFKILALHNESFSNGPILQKLPSRLIMDTSLAREAAKRTLERTSPKTYYDSTEAFLYKEELLRLEASPLFEPHAFAPPPPDVIPILYVTQFGAFSGAEQSFANLILHLDRERFAPAAVLGSRGFLSEKLSTAGVPVYIADFNFTSLAPWNTRYFDSLLKHWGAKIVHINGLAGQAAPMAAYYAKVPIVYHVRAFMGARAPMDYTYAAKIITVSETVARDLRRSDLDPQKIQCIHNGQDLSAFQIEHYDKKQLRLAANIPEGAQVITLIARIAAQKRLEFLLDALPRVVEKFPNTLTLLVGEYYPDEALYYESIQKRVDHLQMRNHVRFWGFEKDIAKIHAMSDILVNCTLDEPFGRSILEALSMHVPVVAPDRGGHLEMLRHLENAVLFDAHNPHSLSTELIRLFNQPDLAKQIAENGFKTVQNFDIARHVEQVENLYLSLL